MIKYGSCFKTFNYKNYVKSYRIVCLPKCVSSFIMQLIHRVLQMRTKMDLPFPCNSFYLMSQKLPKSRSCVGLPIEFHNDTRKVVSKLHGMFNFNKSHSLCFV